MDELFWSVPLSAAKTLCISTVSEGLLRECGISNLGDDFGYFVYLSSTDDPVHDVQILAKVPDSTAALAVVDLLERALALPIPAPASAHRRA